jgi:hypothetical protein
VRGLGVEQIGDQPHAEELPVGVTRQLAGFEQRGAAGTQRPPREIAEIGGADGLEADVEPRDGDEDHGQAEIGGRHVDHEADTGAG